MKWFRLYHELLDDPKVQNLSPELFKFWINILCIACRYNGKLPEIKDIAYHMRSTEVATKQHVNSLEVAQLLHRFANQHSTWLAPRTWKERQYKSDSSTQRVKRFRNGQRNGPRTETETETETERSARDITVDLANVDNSVDNSAFCITSLLDSSTLSEAQDICEMYGEGLAWVVSRYNAFYKKPPDYPDKAFITWLKRYLRGKHKNINSQTKTRRI